MRFTVTCIAVLVCIISNAQDTSTVFGRITNIIKEYKIDTAAVPEDKITKTIRELRSLKAITIDDAIAYKIQEEMHNNPSAKDSLQKVSESFKTGVAGKWLDNAVTWIYREEYTYDELKQLVKFYKTPVGQKTTKDFPIILLKSLAAADIILKSLNRK